MDPDRKLVVLLEKITLYKCDICRCVFADHLSLKKHSIHHNQMYHAHVTTYTNIKMHSAHVVLSNMKFHQCEECVQCFQSRKEYMHHKIKHVRNTKIVTRSPCDDAFISKPYQCSECDYRFSEASTLEAHSILHQPFPLVWICDMGNYMKKGHFKQVKTKNGDSIKQPIMPSRQGTSKSKFEAREVNKPNTAVDYQTRQAVKFESALSFKTKKAYTKRRLNMKFKHVYVHPNIGIKSTRDGKFLCPVCKKKYSRKFYLYIHYRIQSGERRFRCKVCNKGFTQYGTMKVHLARHTGVMDGSSEIYTCPICPKRFKKASQLLVHRQCHRNNLKFSCKMCGKLFNNKSVLNHHMFVHTFRKNATYYCDYCLKYFSKNSDLIIHVKNMHSNIENYRCNYCSESYRFSFDLDKHMKVHHKEAEVRKGDYCDRNVYSEEALKRHNKLTYEDIRQKYYECNECSTTCEDKSSITRHILIEHTNISCDKCLEYFPSYSALEHHERDEGEPCGICAHMFFCKGSIQQHLKLHTMLKKADDSI